VSARVRRGEGRVQVNSEQVGLRLWCASWVLLTSCSVDYQDNWQQSNGRAVSREELLMTLAGLDSINMRTVYDNHMVSVAISDITMDSTSVAFSTHGHAKDVEECR